MTPQELTKRMNKVYTSLSNHVARGATPNAQRSYELIDRYQQTKEEMRDADLWDGWCKSMSFCPSHDAYDTFA